MRRREFITLLGGATPANSPGLRKRRAICDCLPLQPIPTPPHAPLLNSISCFDADPGSGATHAM